MGVPTETSLPTSSGFRARWLPSGRSIGWPLAMGAAPFARALVGTVPVYVRGFANHPPEWGSGWEPYIPVQRDAQRVAFVWRDQGGNLFLPFDPDAAVLALLSEAYLTAGGVGGQERVKAVARRAYYRARPVIPRAAQLALRRQFSRLQRRQEFPRWPVETALHDLYAWLLERCAEVAGEPVPWLAAWPQPHAWAFVLTHDVETRVGYSNIGVIRKEERRLGYGSSWNLVPQRDYVVEDELVAELQENGCEVGVHGLHHDGRDLESSQVLGARLPQIREWANRWHAHGFRAPATQRHWDLMPLLGFDYDSSYPDTDPFEPQGGGCCSWLPFFNDGILELPITLPQDHTLFAILGEVDARLWLEKARLLRERGGMALVDTHPDYLCEEPAASAYWDLLTAFADDETAWRALPGEVANWWRRRAATRIERGEAGWRLVGPASADAVIAFTGTQAA